MSVVLLLLLFLVFAMIGIPIAVSLGISSLVFLVLEVKVPLAILVQRIFGGIDSFPLMAIPFFVLAGAAMNAGGITDRIVSFSNSVIGWVRGGLALINILASMLFGGISGSAVADTSSIGGVLIPAMKKEGYEADFAAAVTAFSSGLGPIIPPSITMIVYGVITGTSISRLFLAGAVPGILFGLGLLIFTYFIAVKRKYPRHRRVGYREFFRSLKDVIWALLMPVIIIGGILSGIFTVTEAAAVAAVYSLLVGIFIYRELNSFRKLYETLYSSAMIVASIMILIGCAQVYSWLLVIYRVPQLLTAAILSITDNPLVVLALINVTMLVVGMFVEANAAMILFVPILFPMAGQFGIDPIHLGIILVFNLCLGLVTPPVGLCISLASKIADVPLHKAVKATIPFMSVGFAVLLVITYIPKLVLFLPTLVYK